MPEDVKTRILMPDSCFHGHNVELRLQDKYYKLHGRCYENWVEIASNEMKIAVVDEAGGIEPWLKTKIEAEVAKGK